MLHRGSDHLRAIDSSFGYHLDNGGLAVTVINDCGLFLLIVLLEWIEMNNVHNIMEMLNHYNQ